MRLVGLIPLALLALLLQMNWPAALRLDGVRPDFLLLLVLHHALYGEARQVPAVAFGLGLCRDALSGAGLGPAAGIFLVAACAVCAGRRAVHREEWVPRLLAACAAEIAVEGLAAARFGLYGGDADWAAVLYAGLYTAAVGLAALVFLDALRPWLGAPDEEPDHAFRSPP